LRVGHERGAALLPAGDEADPVGVLVEAVEHGQKAFARHAEHGVDPLGHQGLHQGMAGDALRHGHPRCNLQRRLSTGGAADLFRASCTR
jgi:hypothetical protein